MKQAQDTKEPCAISETQQAHIAEQVRQELVDKHYKMIRRASLASLIAATIGLWTFYDVVSSHILIGWYIAMAIIHLANIAITFCYDLYRDRIQSFAFWHWLIRLAIFLSASAWGSMGVLLAAPDPLYQVIILFYLILISTSLAFGTLTDYSCSVIGLSCMLLPFATWQFYQHSFSDAAPHLQYGAAVLLYWLLLCAMAFLGNRFLRQALVLTYSNIVLRENLADVNEQLGQVNQLLEKRVEQRTQELQEANQDLEYQASHDTLTGLVNQDELLNEEINTLINFADQSHSRFAVIYLTINNLPEITNNYGIKFDNDAVCEMALRLKNKLSSRYRLLINRRDTFVLLLYQFTDAELVQEIENLKHIVDEPFTMQPNGELESIPLKASVGIAIYPEHGDNTEELKMNADLSMSYAKQVAPDQTHHIICSRDTAERIRLESKLKREIMHAITRDEFFLVYQVVIDLHTNLPCAAEVLIRWQHPTLGLIPPANFIELAERNGEIVPLGRWILHQACQQAKKIHQSFGNDIKIAVNLSARQLQSESLIEDIQMALYNAEISPESIELELTETAKFGPYAQATLREIDRLGINLSIDDFGQGQSGLNMLKDFDFIKKIKLDRAFIKDLPEDPRSKEIIINSTHLARKLSSSQRQITVLAEGIDKIQQLNFLREVGIDMAQGFLFSKPIPIHAFIKYLHKTKDGLSGPKQQAQ